MYDAIQSAIFGLTTGGVYALLALGFSLIFQTTGLLSFAHPQVMMIGGMVGYTALSAIGVPYAVAAALCALAGAAVSVLIELLVLGPIQKRKGSDLHMIVATIGVGLVLSSAAVLIWGPYSLPYPKDGPAAEFRLGGFALSESNITVLATVTVTLIVFQILLKRTKLGLAMRAAASDPGTAKLVGVPVRLAILSGYALSGALAGLAGVLIGSMYYASFDMGASGLKALCAAVIGGFGSLPGAVLGGFLLGILESVSTSFLAAQYNETLIYGLLIVILLVWPQGLFGRRVRKI